VQGEPPYQGRCAVRGIVVDEDYLVTNTDKCFLKAFDQQAYVPYLVKGRKHNRQIVRHSFLRGALAEKRVVDFRRWA
jgi:hypothetical protein